jgi:hypothetical protein
MKQNKIKMEKNGSAGGKKSNFNGSAQLSTDKMRLLLRFVVHLAGHHNIWSRKFVGGIEQ